MTMGTGESGTPTKSSKASTPQDQLPVAPASYLEWAAAFQAYYNGATPPPGYFPPAVAPGQPHPYMWAGQPVLPPSPYSAASPFAAMYPYGHPSMPQGTYPYPFGMTSAGGSIEASMAAVTADQGECKSSDGKELSPAKGSKAHSPGRARNKGRDVSKSAPTSMNGVLSQSAESGSDGSSDGSEEDTRHNVLEKKSYGQPLEAGSVNSTGVQGVRTGLNQTAAPSTTATGRSAGIAPTTNLNVGLDYWNAAPPGAAAVGKGKKNPALMQALAPNLPNNPLLGIGNRDGPASEFWLQDERELKRQRRKQSNRESARRSRLRKQAECEELATRVDSLTVENMALRSEIGRLGEERDKLSAENKALLEQLKKRFNDDNGGTQMQEEIQDPPKTCGTQDNGKIQDVFDANSRRTQGYRLSKEEPGKAIEQVSIGLDVGGGNAAAVTAN